MFVRTAQPGLWFIAGSLAQCRIYSKYLGLQIKACEVGLLPRERGELSPNTTEAVDDARAADPEERPSPAGGGAVEAAGRLEGRPVPGLADDPDRPLHQRGRRRSQLPRALSQAVGALHHPGDRGSRRGGERPAGRAVRRLSPRDRLAASRRPRRRVADRGVGPRHGGVGCGSQGRRRAARRFPRRNDRPGARLQQQRAVADARRDARGGGGGARRRRRVHRPEAPAGTRPARRRSGGHRRRARGGRRRR